MWWALGKDDPSLSSSMIHRPEPNFLRVHLIYYNKPRRSSIRRKATISKSIKVDVYVQIKA